MKQTVLLPRIDLYCVFLLLFLSTVASEFFMHVDTHFGKAWPPFYKLKGPTKVTKYGWLTHPNSQPLMKPSLLSNFWTRFSRYDRLV